MGRLKSKSFKGSCGCEDLNVFESFFWYHWYPKKQFPGRSQSRGPKWMLGSTWLWIVEPEAVGSPNSTPKRADFDMEMPPTCWTTFGVPPHAPFWIHSGRRCPSRDFALATISFSVTRAGSKVLKPPLTNFLKNELWNEDNSVILKTQPAFLILSETILPAKVTKEVLPLQCIAERIWVGTLRMLSFYVLKFSFFQSRFRVGHCCGSKPGKLMMYIRQMLCIVVPFDGVAGCMWVFLFHIFLAK